MNPDMIKISGMMIGMGKRSSWGRSNLPWAKRWLTTGWAPIFTFYWRDDGTLCIVRWVLRVGAWKPVCTLGKGCSAYIQCHICLFVWFLCLLVCLGEFRALGQLPLVALSWIDHVDHSDMERVLWQCGMGWGKNSKTGIARYVHVYLYYSIITIRAPCGAKKCCNLTCFCLFEICQKMCQARTRNSPTSKASDQSRKKLGYFNWRTVQWIFKKRNQLCSFFEENQLPFFLDVKAFL